MSLTTATDAACSLFNDAWGATSPVEWPNAQAQDPALYAGSSPWARVTVAHAGGEQRSMGRDGERVFEAYGTVTVSVFVPAGKKGLADSDALADLAASAFRGKTRNGVRFSRVGARTVGADGPWHRVDVEAEYDYDEVA